MFAKLDVNGDGDLTEVGNSQILGIDEKFVGLVFQDEFVAGCLSDEILVRRLTPSAEEAD